MSYKEPLANYFYGLNEVLPELSVNNNRPGKKRPIVEPRRRVTRSMTKGDNKRKTVGNITISNNKTKKNNKRHKEPFNVRTITRKNIKISEFDKEKFYNFSKTLLETPVYFINGHSCICKNTGKCYDEVMNPYFSIPLDTYILTLAEVEDTSCLNEFMMVNIANLENKKRFITKSLLLHSPSDAISGPKIGKTRFSFLSHIKRATQYEVLEDDTSPITYPNIAYSFNPDEDIHSQEKNVYGVYRIDDKILSLSDFNNTKSVIPQNLARKNWFLEDIIKEVYEATGLRKGIFINGGCLTSCSKKSGDNSHMKQAAQTIYYNNVIYPTLRETITRDEAEKIKFKVPRNYGLKKLPFYEEIDVYKYMVEHNLYDAEEAAKLNKLYHHRDLNTIRSIKK